MRSRGRSTAQRRPARAGRAASLAALVALLAVTRVAVAAPTGELHVGVPRVPASLDPADATASVPAPGDAASLRGARRLRRAGRHRARPRDGWAVSRDGLVWTFRLRQDVQLHDGTPARARRGRRGARRARLRRRAPAGAPPGSGRSAARTGSSGRCGGARARRSRSSSRSRTRRCSRSWPIPASRSPFRGRAGRGSGAGPTGPSSSRPIGSCWKRRRPGEGSPRRAPD